MKNYLLALTTLLYFQSTTQAQSCANYTAVRSTGIVYNSVAASANVIPYWRGQVANQDDDNRSNPIPIGFDFWYLGKRYTTCNISINGFIDFSTATYDGNWPLSDPSPQPNGYALCGQIAYREQGQELYQPPVCGTGVAPNSYEGTYWALAAMYTDLWCSNGVGIVANSIKYLTTGTAPNRVFTVEYVSMDDWNTPAAADYNFQIKIYETTGVIEFVYGTMMAPPGSPSDYSCGINGQILTNPPAPAEMLVQQGNNSNAFSNTTPSLSNVVPTSNSMIRFTPPASANPISPLTFTSVGNTSMTVNWLDWASNEQAYVVYMSTDNITYNFYAQTLANVTSLSATGLFGSIYYWKVYAVTEGALSLPASGAQATLSGGVFTSIKTGVWSDPTTWDANAVPTSGDSVIIANSHTVTIDGNYGCTYLQVGKGLSGTLLLGNNATSRTFLLIGNLAVFAGGSFSPNPSFVATHLLTIKGNIINNGTVNMRPNATSLCNISFAKTANQTISGTGIINNYNNIALDMGNSVNDVLDVVADNFSAPSNFLTMNNGTFKFSVPSNAVLLDIFTSATTIPVTCGIWMNSPNSTMTAHSTLFFQGALTCSRGVLNVGDNADESLVSNGAFLTISGGTVNVAGRLDRPSFVAITNVNISGGTLNLNTIGSTSTTSAPFMVDVPGSSFYMSGGKIVIKNEGGTGAQDLGYININCFTYSVTGGTLQIGNAATSAAQTMKIQTDIPIGNVEVFGTNAPVAKLFGSSLRVVKNVLINVGGTLQANGFNINLGGDWTNNQSLGFTQSTGTVTFDATAVAQNITGAQITTFNNLVLNNTFATSPQFTLGVNIKVDNTLTMTAGRFNLNTYAVQLGQNATFPGTLVYTSGWFQGPGNFQRFFGATANPIGDVKGLFPFGTASPNDHYRPLWLGFTANPTTGGKVGVSHSPVYAATILPVSYPDASWGSTVVGISNSKWGLTLTSLVTTGATALLRYGGQGFGVPSLTNINATLTASAVGTYATGTNSVVPLEVNRIGLTQVTMVQNDWTIGTRTKLGYPLPIELLEFDAVKTGTTVKNYWSTASETNNDYFTVEKSIDGINFEQAKKIAGAGISTTKLSYATIDENPYNGINYYRLKQTDFDGNYNYSQTVAVAFSTTNELMINVWPNPTDGSNTKIQISGIENSEVLLELYNATGALVYTKKGVVNTSGQYTVAIANEYKLSTGAYSAVVKCNGVTKSTRLIIQ